MFDRIKSLSDTQLADTFPHVGYAGWNRLAHLAILMCELDHDGTNGVTSFAVKNSRQRHGDEPVSEEQRSRLRSLQCVLEHPTTDMPNLQFLSIISRDRSPAQHAEHCLEPTCCTYLVRKPSNVLCRIQQELNWHTSRLSLTAVGQPRRRNAVRRRKV